MGEDQIKIFQWSLSGGFFDTISRKMKTMANDKNGVKAGKKIVLHPEVIYALTLALWHNNPDFDFEKLLL